MSSSKKLTHDRAQIDLIIRSSQVVRLGLAMADEPYIVPLAFGYDGGAFYFHTAREGRKLDFLVRNPHVCFEFETNVQLLRDDSNPCRWSFAYESVIGYGRADELVEATAKAHGMGEVIRHYAGTDCPFPLEGLTEVRLWRVTIDSVTAKRSPIAQAQSRPASLADSPLNASPLAICPDGPTIEEARHPAAGHDHGSA
jgi:hypothetical protein